MRPIAVHVPVRPSCAPRWVKTGSEIAAASDAAPAAKSSTIATAATPKAIPARDTRVHRASAAPASAPAGNQATTRAANGWPSLPASCWSGSAPTMRGPMASALLSRSTYSQPVPANTARTTASHAGTRARVEGE
jgi:hypothetical protein